MRKPLLITSGIVTVALLFVVGGCGTNTQISSSTKSTETSAPSSNAVKSSANISLSKASVANNTTTKEGNLDNIRLHYKTPSQYVKAYAKALSYRTGTLARSFLAPNIKNQIGNGPIGATPWIKKWNISLESQNQNKYVYKIETYQPLLYKKNKYTWAFTSVVTVSRYSDGGWIISNQQLRFSKGLNLK